MHFHYLTGEQFGWEPYRRKCFTLKLDISVIPLLKSIESVWNPNKKYKWCRYVRPYSRYPVNLYLFYRWLLVSCIDLIDSDLFIVLVLDQTLKVTDLGCSIIVHNKCSSSYMSPLGAYNKAQGNTKKSSFYLT